VNHNQTPPGKAIKDSLEDSRVLEYDPFYGDREFPEYRAPTDEECFRLWDKYEVPGNIREHSFRVGDIARAIALRASETGTLPAGCDVQAVRAAGLLHDLAKRYCIDHGGQHAQVGAAWARQETGNPLIAQAILHHVWWPLDADPTRHFLPLAVLYADKRVRHEKIVSLGARFADLIERYAKNDYIKERIKCALSQSKAIEAMFEEILGVDLNACTFDSGRLVERA
jgi:putative nucleotidyltransferase with HDIG domain